MYIEHSMFYMRSPRYQWKKSGLRKHSSHPAKRSNPTFYSRTRCYPSTATMSTASSPRLGGPSICYTLRFLVLLDSKMELCRYCARVMYSPASENKLRNYTRIEQFGRNIVLVDEREFDTSLFQRVNGFHNSTEVIHNVWPAFKARHSAEII